MKFLFKEARFLHPKKSIYAKFIKEKKFENERSPVRHIPNRFLEDQLSSFKIIPLMIIGTKLKVDILLLTTSNHNNPLRSWGYCFSMPPSSPK